MEATKNETNTIQEEESKRSQTSSKSNLFIFNYLPPSFTYKSKLLQFIYLGSKSSMSSVKIKQLLRKNMGSVYGQSKIES